MAPPKTLSDRLSAAIVETTIKQGRLYEKAAGTDRSRSPRGTDAQEKDRLNLRREAAQQHAVKASD